MRHVRVRGTLVALPESRGPGDPKQLDMLSGERRTTAPAARARSPRRIGEEAPAVLRSYWRRQPCGPDGSLRKLILVDVHAPSPTT